MSQTIAEGNPLDPALFRPRVGLRRNTLFNEARSSGGLPRCPTGGKSAHRPSAMPGRAARARFLWRRSQLGRVPSPSKEGRRSDSAANHRSAES